MIFQGRGWGTVSPATRPLPPAWAWPKSTRFATSYPASLRPTSPSQKTRGKQASGQNSAPNTTMSHIRWDDQYQNMFFIRIKAFQFSAKTHENVSSYYFPLQWCMIVLYENVLLIEDVAVGPRYSVLLNMRKSFWANTMMSLYVWIRHRNCIKVFCTSPRRY